MLENSNNELESALNQAIKEQVDIQMGALDPHEMQLLSPELRRAKLEQEMRNDLNLSESREQMALAVKILLEDGPQFLEKEEYTKLQENIVKISQNLEGLKKFDAETLQSAFILPPECGYSILKIAKDKYIQGLIDESLAVFHFLTLVNPHEADYWFRFGLAAQKCGKYPLALSAFATVSDLAPEFLGAPIFAAYCHLKMDSKEGALAELASAKKIVEKTQGEEMWKSHISDIEALL